MFCRLLGLMLTIAMPAVHAMDERLGKLPAGASSTNLVSDVAAEICRDHLFDPAFVQTALPKGYRLIRLNEYAKGDADAAQLLGQTPALQDYAVGSLCFMSVGHFVVDDKRIESPSPMPMAFWWARASGPRDDRMQGKVEWVQLASWYPVGAADRAAILATDSMAQFADLKVTAVSPNRWHLSLALPTETLEADVTTSGERKRRKSPEPGFMSVPFSGKSADRFWVITYHGHHHQSARGQWRASGKGVFSSAFGIKGESAVFGTHFQNGWAALSGVYASR